MISHANTAKKFEIKKKGKINKYLMIFLTFTGFEKKLNAKKLVIIYNKKGIPFKF
jgi:hypothetical protein